MAAVPRRCIVSLHGSGNALAAIAAVRHFGTWSGHGEPAEVVTLVHPPTDDPEAAAEIGATVGRLTASHGWLEPIVLTLSDVAAISKREDEASYRPALRRLQAVVGEGAFTEVHYAHDFVNAIPDLMMNAYPAASRITFGDSLGFVFNGRYLVAQVLGASKQEAYEKVLAAANEEPSGGPGAKVRRFLKRRLLLETMPHQAEYAVLILPMDHTGDYLTDKQLVVVPRDTVLDTITVCEAALPELTEYAATVRSETAEPRYVLLLENDIESNSLTFEASARMYAEAVRRNAAKGATILIKPHPLAVEPIAEEISRRLAPDYAVSIIPPELMRFPLELWKSLLETSNVISPLSSCYVTLSYLYRIPVILTSGRAWIEEFYPEQAWEYMLEVDERYREMVDSLDSWDRASPLWSGTFL